MSEPPPHSDIVALDPSLTCTGYACGDRAGNDVDLHELGRITAPAAKKRPTVAIRLCEMYQEILDVLCRRLPGVIVIETPARQAGRATGGKKKKGQSVIGQARYGMAVGVALAASWKHQADVIGMPRAGQIVTSDADDWTHQVKKEERLEAVAQRFELYRQIRAKDTGGDIGDAIALMQWYVTSHRGGSAP